MEELKLKTINTEKHLQGITSANGRYDAKQKAKIANAAKEFESLLTAMMLKEMNKTTGGMLGEEGYGNDMFDTIFEQKIASQMSKSKSLGIAKAIYKKVTGEEMEPGLINSVDTSVKENSGSTIEIKNDPAGKNISAEIKNDSAGKNISALQPSNVSLSRLGKFDELIEKASQEFGIDKNVIKSIIMAESAANHKAVSGAKAKGLMQLLDSTAADMGVRNSFDPAQNIYGGTKYFANMLRQYNGDLKLALAAYNAGPQNVEKYNGVPPFNETKNYITKVLGYLNHFSENDL
ncbi:MAG: transglycosylase SLT domain-containing protein [Ignavibacteriales bacterium]|nr:transglycosylase SLT domain-containing protein [Ignavibacteriales bacterium]